MRILLIDDDIALCQMTQKLLIKNGYSVDVFHSADSALKYAAQNIPDLILMDIMLPGSNGPQVVETLKLDPEFKDVPVIFLTALVAGNEDALEAQGIMVGGQRYQILGKPFDIDRLIDIIKSYQIGRET